MHSPFVYELVTRCFYNRAMNKKNNLTTLFVKDKKLSGKQIKFLNKLINYFQISEEGFSSERSNILKSSTGKFDIIYFDTPDQFNTIETTLHTSQIALINNINSSKKQNDVWKSIIKQSAVTVTVDIYVFGLIFFRKEQAKEHFIIRP